jgi:hypothetical protein
MKYISKFNIERLKPQIGDYIICKDVGSKFSDLISEFLSKNIGRVNDINGSEYPYRVEYTNTPPGEIIEFFGTMDDKRFYRVFNDNEILYFSKNKEDLEIYLDISKYNL